MRNRWFIVTILAMLAATLSGCGAANQFGPAKVTITVVDEANSIEPNVKFILCIHDENDDSKNYSEYTTKKTVTFDNVTPGDYICHFGSNWTLGQRAQRVTVRQGDDVVFKFTAYYDGTTVTMWSPYGSYEIPVQKWRFDTIYR